MKKGAGFKILIAVAIILFVIQLGSLFLIYKLNTQTIESIIGLEGEISFSKLEFQGKIDSLTGVVGDISSEQGSLKEELSEVKATASADFSGIIEESVRGIVSIRTDASQGTGFFIDSEFVVTNAHVLSGANYAKAISYEANQYDLTLIGYDLDLDVALLRAQGDFPYLELEDSDDVKIGEKVIAIGNPLGLSFTATEGIVSAKDREGLNNKPYYFQTDVSLNPGNSGGPLINTQGNVIGINNFKVASAEGIGFALEINEAIIAINEIAELKLNQTLI
jgi:S1-C subfamily serine protease